MTRAVPRPAPRHLLAAALLALAAAATIAQPSSPVLADAAAAQAMTLPPTPAVAQR